MCAGSIKQMDCNLFSGSCHITMFSLYLLWQFTIRIYLHCSYRRYQFTINLHFTSCHLVIVVTCYKLEEIMRVWEPNCCCKTTELCYRSYVLLWARRSLCPDTQRTKKLRRRNWQRLLAMESDLSDVVFAWCAAGNTTNTIRCPGATETKTYASVRRASVHDGVCTLS